jgi:AcrR family transcriptional regulator
VQARSAASVDAILQATVQVLLSVGKERLTTTRVASRAGVSVGTLYQYFPNKRALLQAVLKHHFDEIAEAVQVVCQKQRGSSLQKMGKALVVAFLEAKMRSPKMSAALYSAGSDVDGARMVKQLGAKINKAVIEMLKTSSDPLNKDPQLVASVLQGAMAGIIRGLLESPDLENEFEVLQAELISLVCAYLRDCSV